MDFEEIPLNETDPAYGRSRFISYARAQRRAKEERDPDIGDVVHYWDGGACRAAIVTHDDLDTVWLSLLMPGEPTWRPVREVAHDESKDASTWHWPCGGQ